MQYDFRRLFYSALRMVIIHRITPFGYPGVNGYVLLTPAFRSLSRPSSPGSSKASAIDLYSLDHIIFSALKLLYALTKAFYSSFLLFALAV